MASHVLILSILTSYGGVNTQRVDGFPTHESCAPSTRWPGRIHGVRRIRRMRACAGNASAMNDRAALDYELRGGRTFAAAKSIHAIRMPSAM
jgi:hypothetical protein